MFPVEVTFNYMGRFQQLEHNETLFKALPVPEECGKNLSKVATGGISVFDISVVIEEGCAHVSMSYDRDIIKLGEKVTTWAKEYEATLTEMARLLISKAAEWTLSDFPLAFRSYDDLDNFTQDTIPRFGLAGSLIQDIYPSAPAQRGIFLSQAKSPRQYMNVIVWRVSLKDCSPVDIPRLHNAWQQVVDRHPMLRTLLISASQNAFPDQIVLEEVTAHVELSVSAETRVLDEQSRSSPLHKLLIGREVDGSVTMQLLISHALIDGGSTPVIQRDLALAYDGKLSRSMPPVFRNYVSHLQQLPQQSSQLYWQKYVDGLNPCHMPALLGPTPGLVHGATKSVSQSMQLLRQAQRISRMYEVTTTNLVHVAWALVLRCFTGTDDVCFGYLNSGRDVPVEAVQDAVGPFFNILVRRIRLPQTSDLLSILLHTQEELSDNLSHQHYPLADLYHANGLAGRSLFNTLVSVQESVDGVAHDSELIMDLQGAHQPTEYAITLNLLLTHGSIEIGLDYDTLLFSEFHASVILQSFCQALSHVISDERVQVGDTSLVHSDTLKMITELNGAQMDVVDKCVYELIVHHCETSPDRPAVCAWDGSLSYGELDQLSDVLASKLISRGVGTNHFVPICLSKSFWTPVAILAILKAGGAFVLLDVSFPQSRLRDICNTIQATVIITSEGLRGLSSKLAPEAMVLPQTSELLRHDDLHSKSWKESVSVGPRDPAYAVFTSGSTGKPKGVVMENRSFCTQICGQRGVLHLDHESRILQFSGYAFDVAVLDHLMSLTIGGCICIPSEEDRHTSFARAARELRGNWVFLTPSVARAFDPADFPTLQTVCLGGESPRESDITTWSSHGINCIGAYGPAECSISITVQSPLIAIDPRCIGRSPVARTWIVDPQNHHVLLPIGATGELLVEGCLLFRGYLGDPEGQDPCVEPPAWRSQFHFQEADCRLYKTGDLVQYSVDGSLRYMGRKDSQVKLRGQRMEIGEIEGALKKSFPSSKGIVASVVTLDDNSSPFLVAFIQWHHHDGNESVLLSSSHDFQQAMSCAKSNLRGSLPSYMIPSVFLPISSVPLSPTGKTDHKRLRAELNRLGRVKIERYHSSKTSPKRGLLSEDEKTLQRLLMLVLNLPEENIDLDEDFFYIGGDSLSAIKLVNVAGKEGLELSVADIFHTPILSDLAKRLRVSR
jgi:amino acid adenylation domain-containing protein/non-ribosomal peptide synthase protein (TIGR01720 family)